MKCISTIKHTHSRHCLLCSQTHTSGKPFLLHWRSLVSSSDHCDMQNSCQTLRQEGVCMCSGGQALQRSLNTKHMYLCYAISIALHNLFMECLCLVYTIHVCILIHVFMRPWAMPALHNLNHKQSLLTPEIKYHSTGNKHKHKHKHL